MLKCDECETERVEVKWIHDNSTICLRHEQRMQLKCAVGSML
jgi:hypothetical protein